VIFLSIAGQQRMSENQNHHTNARVIVPPNPLIERVTITGSGQVDLAPVQRAEQALKQLAVAFDGWLANEVEALSAARDVVRAQGLTKNTGGKLYLAAHDLKGLAETYGYPLIARVCSTLCLLLDAATQHDRIPIEIIDHHVNAVRKMMLMKMKAGNHPQGVAVANRLHDVVSEFARHEAKRP